MNPLLKKFITDVMIYIVIGVFFIFFIQIRWQPALGLVIKLLIITEIFRWVPEKNMSVYAKALALIALGAASTAILILIQQFNIKTQIFLFLLLIFRIWTYWDDLSPRSRAIRVIVLGGAGTFLMMLMWENSWSILSCLKYWCMSVVIAIVAKWMARKAGKLPPVTE